MHLIFCKIQKDILTNVRKDPVHHNGFIIRSRISKLIHYDKGFLALIIYKFSLFEPIFLVILKKNYIVNFLCIFLSL